MLNMHHLFVMSSRFCISIELIKNEGRLLPGTFGTYTVFVLMNLKMKRMRVPSENKGNSDEFVTRKYYV